MSAIVDVDGEGSHEPEKIPTWKHRKNTTPCSQCGQILDARNIGLVRYTKVTINGECLAKMEAYCSKCAR